MNDSLEKIFTAYFACMAVDPFTYKLGRVEKRIHTRTLNVSPLLFRGLDCPPMCGECCGRHTLDWLPLEQYPAPVEGGRNAEPRFVEFNGNQRTMMTIFPDEGPGRFLHLNPENGRCNIHSVNPFSCSFEIMRFLVSDEKANLLVRTYGRGWNMPRVDGGRGAFYGITAFDEGVRSWLLSQFDRMRLWMEYYHMNTVRLDSVIDWTKSGPHSTPLRFAAGSGTPTGVAAVAA